MWCGGSGENKWGKSSWCLQNPQSGIFQKVESSKAPTWVMAKKKMVFFLSKEKDCKVKNQVIHCTILLVLLAHCEVPCMIFSWDCGKTIFDVTNSTFDQATSRS